MECISRQKFENNEIYLDSLLKFLLNNISLLLKNRIKGITQDNFVLYLAMLYYVYEHCTFFS